METDEMPRDQRGGAGAGWTKIAVLLGLLAAVIVAYTQFRDALSLESLARQETLLRQHQLDHPVLVHGIAFAIYVLVTGLSLPGAAVLTLVLGWYLGVTSGVILVSFASTSGATVAFLLSRYLLRDWVEARFGDRLKTFHQALEREGAFYLFTLRLIPAVPFFVINAVMGLTRIRVWTFWWVSQLGMLAGTIVYVYAGSTIPGIEQIADPSQLRTSDVRDTRALLSALDAASKAVTTEPGSPTGAGTGGMAALPGERSTVWRLLPENVKALIRARARAGGELDARETVELVTGINHILKSFDLERSDADPEAVRDSTKGRSIAEKERTRRNRAALVRLFPGEIKPPNAILSWQLILAFVLLGVFPIAAKKVLGRLRPGQAAQAPEPREQP